MTIVPYQKISAEALQCLLEEFVTRDGTDYGSIELSLEEKVRRAHHQLEQEEVIILFDEESETCNIVSKQELAKGV